MDSDVLFSVRAQRLITVGVCVVFVLVWIMDLARLVYKPLQADSPTVGLTTLGSGPLAAAALLRTDRRPSLAWRAGIAAVLSTALTVWAPAIPYRQGPASWGALETVSLLALITLSVRQVPRPGVAFGMGAALSVAVLLHPLRVDGDPRTLGSCFVLLVCVVAFTSLGAYLRLLQARRARALVEVRQDERLELARELHDFVAHHVTGMIVQANAALAVHATSPEAIEPILLTITRSGSETLSSMRRLVHILRAEERGGLQPGELFTELGRLVSDFTATGVGTREEGQARLDVASAVRTARLTPEVETSVHRVVQEALTNARRHAPDADVNVRLDVDRGRLLVAVVNTAPDRRGAPPAGGRGGFGLVGLRERIEALDGTLHTGPTSDGGWSTRAVVPLVSAGYHGATESVPASRG
ncbi:sensor histidine kinase [Streptomyces fuscichromogenes]|uniref:histidine kinase n=1 Tax=Streptomyces fuscichromogenes TaxID=1324013 RepID=A0A917XFB6_9ACTN|nr:histidine kinase [Streptomyces fuscichromogenes]GGN19571.1 two-component sensor histidine kinase [Streptomyces fuscichromogenes]